MAEEKVRILILGITGMLGNTLFRYFNLIDNYKVLGTLRNKLAYKNFSTSHRDSIYYLNNPISNSYNENNVNKITGKVELEYEVLKDFSITGRLGYNYVDIKNKSFSPLVYYGAGHNQTNALPDGSPIVSVDPATGESTQTHNRVNEGSIEYFRYNFEVLGNYSFSIDNEHNFDVFARFSMTKNTGQVFMDQRLMFLLIHGNLQILVLQQELKNFKLLVLGIQ